MPQVPQDGLVSDHEIIGSDILAVITTLPLADLVLGVEMANRLRAAKPDAWYPVGILLAATDRVAEKIGRFGLLQLGRQIFETSHAANFKKRAKSAADALYGINAMYRRANRGSDIGTWEMVAFRPGYAEMIKTTPHHCFMVEGIVSEVLRTLEIPALVEQKECVRKGTGHCRFVFTSPIVDERWMGSHPAFPG